MGKKKLFISYCSDNLDKVNHIKKELKDHQYFEPLIVADKRKANVSITKLVTEGIDSSYRIITILSPQSYRTQWINQEIGYATCKNIPIIPIVEASILEELKGFVNKQNQCPYLYKGKNGASLRNENKGFMSCFRLLIQDLQDELGIIRKEFSNKETNQISIVKNSYFGGGKTLKTINTDGKFHKTNIGGKYLKKYTDKGFYVNLLASNGEVILTSELCSSNSSLNGLISAIRESCDKDERYVRKTSSNSKYYFTLMAANGMSLGVSEMYNTKAGMENGIESVKKNGKAKYISEIEL